jgi:cellulose synthase operon protein C
MVKVECDGCKAPYQIDEKRIPPAGLKMRCPKCGTNLVVMKPGSSGAEADLPAPAPPRPEEMRGGPPRPAAPRPAAPPPPEPQRESHAPISSSFADLDLSSEPPARPSRGGFGDIDLMGDLPPSGGFSPGDVDPDFGSQDLPAIHAAPAPKPKGRGVTRNRTMDLGVDFDEASFASVKGADMEAAFGDVDLPAVHADGGLPGFPGGALDLPSPHGSQSPFHGAPRAPSTPPGALGFGDIDLPAPPHHGGGGGFGEIDLPTAMEESGFPAPRGREPSFGHIDLPLTFNEAALPAVAPSYGLPSPAAGPGLPSPAFGGPGLPMPAAGPGLPSPAYGGVGLPAPPSGRGRLPSSPSEELPAALQSGPREAAFDHGEMDLGGDAPLSSGGARHSAPVSMGRRSAPASAPRSAFDDSDRAVSTTAGPNMDGAVGLDDAPAPAPVGDEVDISGSAMVDGGPVRSERARPAAKPAKSGRSRRIVILTVVALAVGGGALALEPSIGPFGVNFISDRINAKGYAARLDALRTSVQADFDEDTAAAATRAFTSALAAQVAVPRHRPTAAYAAYVALARGLRFGHRTEDDTRAAQLLTTAGTEPSDTLTLALAAQAAGKGQLPEARKLAADLLQRSPKDMDAADLAGEIELAARAPEAAVKAWKQAVAVRGDKKSARALFGLARAEAAAGNTAGAEASARAAIAASPTHAGARNLLASLLGQAPEGEAEALTLLKAVTDDAAVRGASSDADLIDAYTLIGRIHLTRSRVSAAEQAFAAALKLDPQAVQALIGNGELFYRSGRNSEALARFEAATRADADNVIAKVGVAKTWLALERMKEAKDLLKAQRAAHPGESLVLYWLGRSEEALGNKKEAESAYNEAIKVGGVKLEVVDAYVAAARLLSGAGRTDDAAQMLAEASKKFPELPALHRAKGDVALQTGRYEEARDEFKSALEHDDDLGTRFKLGVALRRMRAFPEATAVFDAIGAVDKDYPGLALERGLMFEETGQSDKALESYSDALRKAPDDVDLKLRVGSTQVIAGHAQQAEAILREVVKARAGSAEANHFLGRALLAKGANLTEAMKFLEAAVNIDGNRAEYHLYVGWAANDTGQPARADTALKKALELDKGLGDAYWQRGILRQKSGEANDALQDLKTALEKRPSRFEAYATMAFCYQDLLRWPEAEAAWRSAIAGNPAVPEWHYRLGKILASHGSAAASAPELEQAVKLAEAAGAPLPGWLYDANLLLAEAVRGSNKALAIESYRRFLELAPRDSPYVSEAEKALTSLGSSRQR